MNHLKSILLLWLLFTGLAIGQEPSSKNTKASKAIQAHATLKQSLAKKFSAKTEELSDNNKRKATKAKPAALAMQDQLRKKYSPSIKKPILLPIGV